MSLQVEDLNDQSKYRQLLAIPYDDLLSFVLDQIRRKSAVMAFFWSVCFILLAIALTVRINIAPYFPLIHIILHTFLGLVIFPVLYIPVHEFLHIIPYWLSGAKGIRIGLDLKQYMFYVTAHRYVASPAQFRIVALMPFLLTTITFIFLVLLAPGLWKWSLALFLVVHTTMCVGDFAMLNFYFLNRKKKIYTWDDFDAKMAYFYEEI